MRWKNIGKLNEFGMKKFFFKKKKKKRKKKLCQEEAKFHYKRCLFLVRKLDLKSFRHKLLSDDQ